MTPAATSPSRTPRSGCRSGLCTSASIWRRFAATRSRLRPSTSGRDATRRSGPRHRFGAVLFVEKEGFLPLFEAVQLAERYDLAIMSTKGMSVTAARELVEFLCSTYGVPLLVLHDFDKSGFSIVGTLRRSTRRYRFAHGHAASVIDLGLRLEDVAGLETEDVHIDSRDKARWNLRENGATPEEIEFLLEQRVELNAFASDELIDWIEGKLEDHTSPRWSRTRTRWRTYQCMRAQALVQGLPRGKAVRRGSFARANLHGHAMPTRCWRDGRQRDDLVGRAERWILEHLHTGQVGVARLARGLA